MTPTPYHRRGITLMEVLIAVGILAVGLSSVVALLPAGHSLAQRSYVTDQATAVAANAAADLITQGFLKAECFANSTPPVLYDPFGSSQPGFSQWALTSNGLFGAGVARGMPLSAYLARAQDDLVYELPEDANLSARNRFSRDGLREYQGKFTWGAMLTRATSSGNATFEPGDKARLTVVVFHQRQPGLSPISLGQYASGAGQVLWTPGATLVPGRRNGDVLRTGSVLLLVPPGGTAGPSARRLALAALNTLPNGQDYGAFVDLEDGAPPGGPVFDAYLLPDAVAVFEQLVTIEGPTGYAP